MWEGEQEAGGERRKEKRRGIKNPFPVSCVLTKLVKILNNIRRQRSGSYLDGLPSGYRG